LIVKDVFNIIILLFRASVNQFYRFVRDILSWKLCDNEELFKFGGPGHIVQIDESVVTKRKYHTGRKGHERWILGIYDATQKRGLVTYVRKRDTNMLLPIQAHVNIGSTIYTNQ